MEVTEEDNGHALAVVNKGNLAAQSEKQNNFFTCGLYGKIPFSMKLKNVKEEA